MKSISHSTSLRVLSMVLVLGLFAGCKPTKYLKGEEKLLVKNSIEINGQKGEKFPDNLEYDLSTLEKQKPNERWLGFSTGRIYEKNLKKIEEGGLEASRPWRVKRGVPLAIYDQELTEETRKTMEYYLNNLGYFNASVSYDTIPTWSKRLKVKYSVNPGSSYTVKSVNYVSEDAQINLMINAISGQSLLKPGTPVSNDKFSAENNRILNFLQNNGYASIDRNFLRTIGDSLNNKVDVTISVLPPTEKSLHTRYKVGTVNIYPNFASEDDYTIQYDTIIDGVNYLYSSFTPNIKASTIHRNIFLRSGESYSKDKIIKTERLLSSLNSFRIITVKPSVNEKDSTLFDYNIYLTPRKKLAFGSDFQITQSNNSLSGARFNLLGFFINSSIQNYNYLNGAIQLDFGFKFGTDINFSAFKDPTEKIIFGLDGSTNLGLSWPRFVKWIGPYGLLNKLRVGKPNKEGKRQGLLSDSFYNKLQESGKTKFNMRLSYQDVFDFYQLPSAELDYGYVLPINNNSAFQITHTGVDIFFPTLEPAFRMLIIDRPDIQNSFSSQLFTGFFFKEFTYSYSSNNIIKRKKWDVRYQLELSGAETYLINKTFAPQDTFNFFGRLEFSQFVRTEIAIAQTKELNDKISLAMKFQTGIAHSFGTSQEVPYLRQFFGGGPSSMRGWRIRALGPGGYEDNSATALDGIFFQTGDFQMEANAELRFPIIALLKGAIFLDAGNIWTLDEDPNRPNSKFRLKGGTDGVNIFTPFTDQIALATGFGFRFDVSYFVLRFDLGIKLRNPFEVFDQDGMNGSYWFPDFKLKQFKKDQNLINVGIDIKYPF